MGKVIEFRQLELPLKWWEDVGLWKERHLASTIDRPTEDEALENVLIQAKHRGGKLRTHIGKIERRVYMLELRSFKECPRYFNESERRQWIAKQTGYGVQEIKDILASVDVAMMHELLIDEAEKTHREMVREVMAEMFPYFERERAA